MNELLDLIIATIEDNVSLTGTIDVGQLKQAEGISVEIGPYGTDQTFLNKSKTANLALLFLRKSKDQQICLSELDAIGEYLSKLKVYPSTASIQWVNAEVTTEASYVDKEENGAYIYSMVVSNYICR